MAVAGEREPRRLCVCVRESISCARWLTLNNTSTRLYTACFQKCTQSSAGAGRKLQVNKAVLRVHVLVLEVARGYACAVLPRGGPKQLSLASDPACAPAS